jgi:hypothetical protein
MIDDTDTGITDREVLEIIERFDVTRKEARRIARRNKK